MSTKHMLKMLFAVSLAEIVVLDCLFAASESANFGLSFGTRECPQLGVAAIVGTLLEGKFM